MHSSSSEDASGVGLASKRPRDFDMEAEQLALLLEISQALQGPLQLKPALERALKKLESERALVRGAVVLRGEDGDLRIAAAVGPGSEGKRARNDLADGIAARVARSGRPAVVPAFARDAIVSRADGARPRPPPTTQVCVPILLERQPVGAISVELDYQESRNHETAQRFFTALAGMIGEALRAQRAIEEDHLRLVEENNRLRRQLLERYAFSNLVGTSGPMRQAYEQIAQVAPTDTTVLIRGESGTGKELIAHAIHYASPRAKKPFVKLSLASIPDSLVESELFGYEKGAFTGALSRKRGRFELAEGGTLFFDEIGELNGATQVKLLRVLQEREFERLGGTQTIRSNVRIVAATNKNLEAAIAAREFREDLYYRLNVFSIFVPPLRDRRPDVLLLAEHFLSKYSRQHGKPIRRIATPAIDILMSYHWPGNVRELENTMERAVLTCEGAVIHGHHLPPTLQTAESSGTLLQTSLTEAVEQYEKDLILDALKSARGNRARAARLLSSTERIVNYKVRKHRIDWRRFREPASGSAASGRGDRERP
jgi:Nif-specific regulatory protein